MSRVFDEWWHGLSPEEQLAHDREVAEQDDCEVAEPVAARTATVQTLEQVLEQIEAEIPDF